MSDDVIREITKLTRWFWQRYAWVRDVFDTRDDVTQEALLGYLKHPPTEPRFLATAVRRALIRASAKRRIAITASLHDGDNAESTAVPDPHDDFRALEAREALAAIMARLKPREQALLREHFGIDNGKPKSLGAIARERNTSRQSVSIKWRRIKKKVLLHADD